MSLAKAKFGTAPTRGGLRDGLSARSGRQILAAYRHGLLLRPKLEGALPYRARSSRGPAPGIGAGREGGPLLSGSLRQRTVRKKVSWPTTSGGERPHVTAGEVLTGLVTTPEPEEDLRGTWGHLLSDIPLGDNDL